MTTENTMAWTIKGGPSKWDFINAIASRKSLSPDQVVQMKLQQEKGDEVEMRDIRIVAISKKSIPRIQTERESHLWGFIGYLAWDDGRNVGEVPIVGEYSTRDRDGRIRIIPDTLSPTLNVLFKCMR